MSEDGKSIIETGIESLPSLGIGYAQENGLRTTRGPVDVSEKPKLLTGSG